ncbi:MAG: hydroxyacylglutathione hydrolase [Cuspidothrix sp.]
MHVVRLAALSDNYIFLLHNTQENIVAVVDPAKSEQILQQIGEIGAELVAIFNTHHHYDHVGGNEALIAKFPNLVVYGGKEDRGRIPGQEVFLEDGDRVQFGNRTAEVLFVPGHTRAHIAYYFAPVTPDQAGELFCGDTLFAGGCGRLFEGTPAQMVDSLTKIRNLPDNTRIWCAHEYTLSNLKFAITVDPENVDLQNRFKEVKRQREQLEPTIPSILGVEKLTNPFLRWQEPALQASAKSNDPVQTFARIRGMKDNF